MFKISHLFIAIIVIMPFVGIFDHDLWGPDEPRVAETGREFLDAGNSLAVPRLNREPFLEQPPLYYWTLALSRQNHYFLAPRKQVFPWRQAVSTRLENGKG